MTMEKENMLEKEYMLVQRVTVVDASGESILGQSARNAQKLCDDIIKCLRDLTES